MVNLYVETRSTRRLENSPVEVKVRGISNLLACWAKIRESSRVGGDIRQNGGELGEKS